MYDDKTVNYVSNGDEEGKYVKAMLTMYRMEFTGYDWVWYAYYTFAHFNRRKARVQTYKLKNCRKVLPIVLTISVI